MAASLQFGTVQDGLEDLFLCLELVCVIEEHMPVSFEPLLSLESHRSEHNEVHNHDQKRDNDRDGDYDRPKFHTIVILLDGST